MTIVKVNRILWTGDRLRELIASNDVVAIRALCRIYEYQTAHEQVIEATVDNNTVGFNHSDAKVMTSLAKWYKARNYFTPKQLARVRRSMPKYAGQLLRLMENKYQATQEIT